MKNDVDICKICSEILTSSSFPKMLIKWSDKTPKEEIYVTLLLETFKKYINCDLKTKVHDLNWCIIKKLNWGKKTYKKLRHIPNLLGLYSYIIYHLATEKLEGFAFPSLWESKINAMQNRMST